MNNIDKIAILKTIYNNFSVLSDNTIAREEDGLMKIENLDGDILDMYPVNKVIIQGPFVAKILDSEIQIHNYRNNKEITLKNKRIFSNSLGFIGNDYFSYFNTDTRELDFYDSNFNKIESIKEAALSGISIDTPEIVEFHIKLHFYAGLSTCVINKISNKFEIYSDLTFKDGDFRIVGTEKETRDYVKTFNMYVTNKFKYKLANMSADITDRDNILLSKRSYNDIFYKSNLTSTNYLYCMNNIKGKELYGVIDKSGNEVLTTDFEEVEYINNDSFLIKYNGYQNIYNAKTGGYFFTFEDVLRIDKHLTLPICIVALRDGNYYIVEQGNKVYPYSELTKNIECYRCNEHSNILRFNICNYSVGSLYKYTDLHLIPITNLRQVALFNSCTWTRI